MSEEKGIIVPKGQAWHMERMLALGYDLAKEIDGTIIYGFCYGVSQMALQAFLADDINAFNQRLALIYNTPVDAFKNDFQLLREQEQTYTKSGKLDEAKAIREKRLEIQEFFDGVALYQLADMPQYASFFEKNVGIYDAQKVIPIVLPIALDAPGEKPVLIQAMPGSYTLKELTEYLELLEQELGEHSFSLVLAANAHATNLNYDAQTKQWLLIDSEKFPGQYFTKTDTLAQALLEQHGGIDGLNLISKLYTQEKYAPAANAHFVNLSENKQWQTLHAVTKEKITRTFKTTNKAVKENFDLVMLETLFGDNNPWLELALQQDDNQDNIKNLFATALSVNKIDAACVLLKELLIKNTFNEDEIILLMSDAYQKQYFQLIKPLLDKLEDMTQQIIPTLFGIDLTEESLRDACLSSEEISQDHVRLILATHKVTPSFDLLEAVCKDNNHTIAKILLEESDVKPTQPLLDDACEMNHPELVTILTQQSTLTLNETHLAHTCKFGHDEIAKLAIEQGVQPDSTHLEAACYNKPSKKSNTLIALLLKNGASPTQKAFEHAVFMKADHATLALLIEHGLPLKPELLDVCCRYGNVDAAKFMMEQGIKPTKETLKIACYLGETNAINWVIDQGVKPSVSLLKHACSTGNTNAIKALETRLNIPSWRIERIKSSYPKKPETRHMELPSEALETPGALTKILQKEQKMINSYALKLKTLVNITTGNQYKKEISGLREGTHSSDVSEQKDKKNPFQRS